MLFSYVRGKAHLRTDSDVEALLVIEDKIQQELEGTKRNKLVFGNISRKLMESGTRTD